MDLQFDNLPTGDYRIRPIISLATGIVPVIKKEVAWFVGSMNMELTPQEGTFEEAGGEMVVAVAAKMARPISAQCDEDWITTEVTQLDANGKGSVTVKVKANDTDHFRTAIVTVRQRYSADSSDYLEKTFTVRQYGGLELETPKVEFDAKGGTKTIELRTSLSPVTINLNGNDSWVTVRQEGHNLIITVKPNEGVKRTASITITAWSEKNQGFRSINLNIEQDGNPEGYAEVTPRVVEFPAYGGVTYVQTEFDYEHASQWFSSGPTGPLKRSWGPYPGPYEDQVYITAGPNTTDKATTDTLLVGFTNEKGNYDVGCIIPVIIKQAAGPSDVQEMRNLFVGTWVSDYEYTNDLLFQQRYVFNSDYTFSESFRTRSSESKPWGNWSTPKTGTYTVNSFRQASNCITIYLKRTNETSESFLVVYPHDLRRLMYYGYYLNKEEQ